MTRRILFGSYELLERIGEGGMAEVWRARARGVAGFEKTVVIKRVLPSLMAREDFARLLVREAKIAALLNHPNIVQIFELGEEQGAYFIAMEHVHGCDLASAIAHQPDPRAPGGLSLALRLWIAAEAAKALDYAHRYRADDGRPLHIVHRDVSPQNVLLGYQGQVKVADFGIAMADQLGLGREEEPGLLRGKYAYMSPEQTRGEPLDRRSDVFALGVVLHEMLCGRRLFKAADPRETLERVRHAPIPPIDPRELGAPPLLGEILRHALARPREERYPSAGAMAEDLSRVLVEMNAQVDSAALAEALVDLAPPDDASRANKLRVDLLARAGEDAALGAAADVRGPSLRLTDPTAVLPTSRQLRAETRPVLLLFLQDEALDLGELAWIEDLHDAAVSPPFEGVREVVFGIGAEPEQVAASAARAALRLRRRGYGGAAVLAAGHARVVMTPTGRAVAEPEPETRARGLRALARTRPGVLRCDPTLVQELDWRFALESSDEWPIVVRARTRAERASSPPRLGPCLGRRRVLAELQQAVDAAHSGEGRALLLVGAAGVGKSRLVSEVRAGLAATGAGFVAAHGSEAARVRPFAGLADLVADLCGVEEEDPPETRQRRSDRLRVLGLSPREVARCQELLGLPVAPPDRAGRPRAIELVVAIRKALRALAADAPLVLFVEDIHWMDDATRQALDLLAAGLRGARVFVLATARPGPGLPHLHFTRVDVPELAPDAAAKLFAYRVGARALEEDLASRLHREVGGNPAWVVLLADALRETGRLRTSDGVVHGWGDEPLPLPPAMVARLSARLADLPPRARNLVRSVAAFDAPVDVATVAAVQGLPHDVAEPILRRLLTARLLEPGAGGRRILPQGRWGGEAEEGLPVTVRVAGGQLVRRCIFEALAEPVRRGIHARIADVLRQSGAADDDRVEALAHHGSRAGDDPRVPDELVMAAEVAARRGAPLVAAKRLWEAAQRLRRAETNPERAAALLVRAAETALDAGGTEDAEAILAEASDILDPALRIRRGLVQARLLTRRERWAEVVAHAETLLPALPEAPPGLRGQALVLLGRARLESGDAAGAIATLEAAAASLETAGQESQVGHACCVLAAALARIGEDGRAAEATIRALAAAARHADTELRCGALAAAAEAASARGAVHEACERWVQAAGVAVDAGLEEEVARLGVQAAVACVMAGREGDASRWADRGLDAARRQRLEAIVSLAEVVRAALVLAAHPDPHFVRGMVRAIDHLEGLGRAGEAAVALDMLARAHLALGDVGAAIRTLGRACTLASSAGRPRLHDQLRHHAERLAVEGLTGSGPA